MSGKQLISLPTKVRKRLLLQKLSMKTKVLQMLHLYQIPLILTSTKLE